MNSTQKPTTDGSEIAFAPASGGWRPYRLLVIVLYAGVALVAYVYLSPPLLSPTAARAVPLIGHLSGDLPGYTIRFGLSFLLFGIGALGVGMLLGYGPADLGLRKPGRIIRAPLYWALLGVVVVVGVLSAYQPGLGTYYPYSHTVLNLSLGGKPWLLGVHVLAYFALYYVPWELFFRGFLVLPFLAALPRERRGQNDGVVLGIAALQTLPSTLLHIGHPVSELLGAVLFGLVTAWLVVRTRSIIPGLIIHSTTGIVLDLTIAARAAGLIP